MYYPFSTEKKKGLLIIIRAKITMHIVTNYILDMLLSPALRLSFIFMKIFPFVKLIRSQKREHRYLRLFN